MYLFKNYQIKTNMMRMKKYLKLDTKERSLIKKKGMIRWYG